ncbi:hypothetical protein [Gracilimonas sediminicola]|uniref:Uncharacterized protein n=1 Tax=Gracilimonas sediminicola TaxID=2952158 RepID=A0A9X2RCJ4_9BACT|nr:hypothetical protein [Gracilimonas sediminicola]MCP9290007.1 hypothetical protein [Gracilimonas sediminicola]
MDKVFKRSYKIPLYSGRLYVVLCESLKEAQSELGLEFEAYGPLEDYDGGCFQRGNKYYIMLEHNPEPGVIAHECKHFVNHVFVTCGVELDRFNDEAECYLLGWAVEKSHNTIDKFKDEQ